MSIGENISRIRRHTAALSQEGLAEAVGISTRALCNYETSRRSPTAETLGRIAEALGVSVEVLYRETGQSASTPTDDEGGGGELGAVQITRATPEGGVELAEAVVPPVAEWHPGLRDLWEDRTDWAQRDVRSEDVLRVAALDLRARGYQPLDREGAIGWCHWVRGMYERDLRLLGRDGSK